MQELTKKYTLLAEHCAFLEAQVEQLKRALFGQRSERYIEPDQKQMDLFMADEQQGKSGSENSDDEEDPEPNVIQIEAYQRNRKRQAVLKSLVKREVVIQIPEADRYCSCGCQKKLIRYETSDKFNYIPAVLEQLIEKREVLACPRGCAQSIQTAAAPVTALPKIGATEELLAHLIVSKVQDRQPLYHLEKKLDLLVSRQTIASWLMKSAKALQPIFNLLQDELTDHCVASLDATTFQVLREVGRSPSTKSSLYCFIGGSVGKEVVLYRYNALEHKPFLKGVFADFSGTLHGDASPLYLTFDEAHIKMSYCNAHARRYFEPIAKNTKGPGLAKAVLRLYQKLYRIERQAKNERMTADQRLQLRQKHSKPLMDELQQKLIEAAPLIPPKSLLHTAVSYTLKHRDGLYRFINDGALEIDNNHTEREIKPFVMARKNFLFACSVSGANALALHFSLIRTATKHGLDPYQYYVHILKKIAHCNRLEDYEQLLPWNVEGQLPGHLAQVA